MRIDNLQVPSDAHAMVMKLLEQEADNNDKVPTSESDAEKIRAENIND